VKQIVVPSGTGKGSSDIVRVIYCILLFPVLLLSFILVFVIVTFGQKKRIQWFIVALVNVLAEAFYWQWLAADERKHDVKMTSRMMEQHMYRKPDRKWKAKWNLFLEIFSVKIA